MPIEILVTATFYKITDIQLINWIRLLVIIKIIIPLVFSIHPSDLKYQHLIRTISDKN
jgi:hypothetical protein